MIKVPLVGKFKGQYALVDDCDKWVLNLRWAGKRGRSGIIYAIVSQWKGGLNTQLLHRLILGLKPGDPNVDHKDGNGLNNLRNNLRLATQSQNCMNRQKTWGISKYKGVSWDKDVNKWRSHIAKNGSQICLGRYISEIEAAEAYDKKAIELFGEFARLNFPKNRRKYENH